MSSKLGYFNKTFRIFVFVLYYQGWQQSTGGRINARHIRLQVILQNDYERPTTNFDEDTGGSTRMTKYRRDGFSGPNANGLTHMLKCDHLLLDRYRLQDRAATTIAPHPPSLAPPTSPPCTRVVLLSAPSRFSPSSFPNEDQRQITVTSELLSRIYRNTVSQMALLAMKNPLINTS